MTQQSIDALRLILAFFFLQTFALSTLLETRYCKEQELNGESRLQRWKAKSLRMWEPGNKSKSAGEHDSIQVGLYSVNK